MTPLYELMPVMNPRVQASLLLVIMSTVAVNFLLTIHTLVRLNHLSSYVETYLTQPPVVIGADPSKIVTFTKGVGPRDYSYRVEPVSAVERMRRQIVGSAK